VPEQSGAQRLLADADHQGECHLLVLGAARQRFLDGAVDLEVERPLAFDPVQFHPDALDLAADLPSQEAGDRGGDRGYERERRAASC
jgi:hypothetical protein